MSQWSAGQMTALWMSGGQCSLITSLSNYPIAVSQDPECLSAIDKLSNCRIPIWDSWRVGEGTTEVDILVF
jgi:hypothetical protein